MVPPGLDLRGRVIGSLLPTRAVGKNPELNFLGSEAAAYVCSRAAFVLEEGGTIDMDRLNRNMLSSMPLCFNIFGSLRRRPELGDLLSRVFDIDVARIDAVECEWAPSRATHLNDRTAFDACVTYWDREGNRCFLGIETKYTEPFSQKAYNSDLYQDITSSSGRYKPGAGTRLVKRSTNQLWRMTMLAASMLHRGDLDQGAVAVLSLADDRHARTVVDSLRAELIDENFVKLVELETFADAAGDQPTLVSWAEKFRRRYLDLTPVLQ